MVDAAIGGKTSVNLLHTKNLIGTFHQPRLVIADPQCLCTLPERQFDSGMAEVIKYAMSLDAELFAQLETQLPSPQMESYALSALILRCASIKSHIVAQDEREAGQRALLNFGHTFGHAIEALCDYTLTHGEAISIGMVCAAQLSQRLGYIPATLIERLAQLLRSARLPTHIPPALSSELLLKKMYSDKKSRGNLTLILVSEIGKSFIATSVEERSVLEVLDTNRKN
jgi:3-dehydroquinate synthase